MVGSFVEVEDDASPDEVRAAIQVENGRRILVPRSLLLPQPDGTFFIPLSLAELAGTAGERAAGEAQVISLAEEGCFDSETGPHAGTGTIGRSHAATGRDEEVAIPIV